MLRPGERIRKTQMTKKKLQRFRELCVLNVTEGLRFLLLFEILIVEFVMDWYSQKCIYIYIYIDKREF